MKQIKSISAIILLATVSLGFYAYGDNNEGNLGNSSIAVTNEKVENGKCCKSFTVKLLEQKKNRFINL